MISLIELLDLHASFDNQYGIGDNLLHYLAMPRIFHNGFDFQESKRVLMERQHPEHLDAIKMAPNDVAIFKKRASLLSSNNEAYRIATSSDPSQRSLEDFSYMMPGWSTLFPLKHYLMHHLDMAEVYRGFLPFGAPVIELVNSLASPRLKITASPDYADHKYLQEISLRMSRLWKICPIEVNNIMYLKGRRLVKKEADGNS